MMETDKAEKGFLYPLSWISLISSVNLFACVHLCMVLFLVPDAPRFFRINRRGFDTIHLEWDKPLEPNGILIGYQLKYQTGGLF